MTPISLPDFVRELICRLESAGFPAYAVGGCVRDALLGLTPHDYDLCTAALPEQIQAIFSGRRLVLAGKKHGTVGVVTGGGVVEITTFRTEGSYQDNRHPDWVRFVPSVSEDLARRDFTVNAIAFSPARGFADPFGGRADLSRRVLRTVGDPACRFQEDALRILRGVRFAVRYRLTPEEKTMTAMNSLTPLMDSLASERVFEELCKLIPLLSVGDILTFFPILAQAVPALAPMRGFDQHSPHHAYDLLTHTAYVTASVPPTLPLRWAALLHDTGKVPAFTLDETGRGHFPGHAQLSAGIAEEVLTRLHAPTALRERTVWLISRHMSPLRPDRTLLRRQLSRWGWEATEQLLALQRADFISKGVAGSDDPVLFDDTAAVLREIREEAPCLSLRDLAVNGHDLMALGFPPGRDLGKCLGTLLNRVLEDQIPNTRDALLREAADIRSRIAAES